ncbi:MAG: hydroxyacylglutathione hydrolase [Congregibacter sp.]
MASVSPIPAFSDNYIWLLENSDGTAIVVDPGDAGPVDAALADRGLALSAVLITHHHFDHVGGIASLKQTHACTVYGPDNPAITEIDRTLTEGDHLSVGDYRFEIIAVPGHTLDHIAYYQADADQPLLFCGDTLFAGGCGRIFEGDPAMMHASLSKLSALPPSTAVYCAHEYTLANLRFARSADPENSDLKHREITAKALRAEGTPTVPSTIALEVATNPFLRAHEAEVQARVLKEWSGRADTVEVFAKLRAWKDNF